ncbi:hypothetical protein ABT340_26570 [Streptosporangium sp. NPDC000239]|uniref:hypothetical protein n=1 Tax=Streptosporangium sp. NPDC000239 TaxID=3154248 RepID=UPI0033331715
MSWDSVALTILGATSLATLLLSQIRDILIKAGEAIQAWRQLKGLAARGNECVTDSDAGPSAPPVINPGEEKGD